MNNVISMAKKTRLLKEQGKLPGNYISLSEFCHRELWSTADLHGLISYNRIKYLKVARNYFVPSNLRVTRDSYSKYKIWRVSYAAQST